MSALVDAGSAASRLDAVRELAMGCTACSLHERATQTVFGEGAPEAEVVLVGEQPGDQEEIVNPRLVVALGSIAGRALFGPGYRVTRQRGEIVDLPGGRRGTGTVHPSSLLRIEDDDERHRERERFVDDLSRAWRTLSVRTP